MSPAQAFMWPQESGGTNPVRLECGPAACLGLAWDLPASRSASHPVGAQPSAIGPEGDPPCPQGSRVWVQRTRAWLDERTHSCSPSSVGSALSPHWAILLPAPPGECMPTSLPLLQRVLCLLAAGSSQPTTILPTLQGFAQGHLQPGPCPSWAFRCLSPASFAGHVAAEASVELPSLPPSFLSLTLHRASHRAEGLVREGLLCDLGLSLLTCEIGVTISALGGGREVRCGTRLTLPGTQEVCVQAVSPWFLCPRCSQAFGSQSLGCPGHNPVIPGTASSTPISSWKL